MEKKGICSESVRNVGTSGAVFATAEGTRRKLGVGRIRGEFSCDKSRRFGERLKATTGKC